MQDEKIVRLAYEPEEVAALIGAHANTVYKALRGGKLHAVKLGRKWVIPAKSLEKFLEGKTPAGAGDA